MMLALRSVVFVNEQITVLVLLDDLLVTSDELCLIAAVKKNPF